MPEAASPTPATPPRVTVITVAYNAGALLARTIDAVAALDYPALEHVVVDGGSSDDTPALLAARRDRLAALVIEPDEGIYDAMNKGLALAGGDYVWYLNAGDTPAAPDVLDALRKRTPAPDFVYGHTRLVDDDGRLLHLAQAPQGLDWRAMTAGMRVSHQSILIRRTLAARYDLRYRYVADQKWVVESLRHAGTGLHTGRALSNYLMGGLSERQFAALMREKLRYSFAELGTAQALRATAGDAVRVLRFYGGRLWRRLRQS